MSIKHLQTKQGLKHFTINEITSFMPNCPYRNNNIYYKLTEPSPKVFISLFEITSKQKIENGRYLFKKILQTKSPNQTHPCLISGTKKLQTGLDHRLVVDKKHGCWHHLSVENIRRIRISRNIEIVASIHSKSIVLNYILCTNHSKMCTGALITEVCATKYLLPCALYLQKNYCTSFMQM